MTPGDQQRQRGRATAHGSVGAINITIREQMAMHLMAGIMSRVLTTDAEIETAADGAVRAADALLLALERR